MKDDRLVASPYVDWWLKLRPHLAATDKMSLQLAPNRLDDFATLKDTADCLATTGADPDAFVEKAAKAKKAESVNSVFPVPDRCNNPGFAADCVKRQNGSGLLPEVDHDTPNYPVIDKDTLILAVIDVDIALGHRRFRTADGNTRVLASWQQGDARPTKVQGHSTHLPFGMVQMEQDINHLLKQHSQSGMTGPLDQDGFNRAAGLVSHEDRFGPRALATREAHGTHVLGLAGGADPISQSKFSQKVKLLTVNLPQLQAYGEGGAFLDHYLVYGLRWIMEMTARIAEQSGLDKGSVPLITNISFGKHAGPKDERQQFVDALGDLSGFDEIARNTKLNVVLPVGNDNLARSHAYFKQLSPGAEAELEWRISPDDETSNFVEIWTSPLTADQKKTSPIMIDVVPPDGDADGFTEASHRTKKALKSGLGTVYCDAVGMDSTEFTRFRYQICLSSDQMQLKGGQQSATSGKWTIRIKNRFHQDIDVRAMIQTDQATLPGRRTARRSYFEDKNYTQVDWTGRIADTYLYDEDQDHPVDLDTGSPVRRHGTLNSYAANAYVAAIAGYRRSDGRPAPYSSTGLGCRPHPQGRGSPTAALPSDDGYAHFGILSDGASDGSKVALRGTSFACACATRLAVEGWLQGRFDPTSSTTISAYLHGAAEANDRPGTWWKAKVDMDKVGGGRIDYLPETEVDRF